MNKKLVFLSALMLTACSANSLQHGAEGVRVTHNEPDTSCTYLGDVTGSQGNFFTGGWTSNSNLETGARNDLKNKAWKMGGERGGTVNSKGWPNRKRLSWHRLKPANQCDIERNRIPLPTLKYAILAHHPAALPKISLTQLRCSSTREHLNCDSRIGERILIQPG